MEAHLLPPPRILVGRGVAPGILAYGGAGRRAGRERAAGLDTIGQSVAFALAHGYSGGTTFVLEF